MDSAISARRIAVFIILVVVILVATLALGCAVSTCQSPAEPSGSSGPSPTSSPPFEGGESDTPRLSGGIPSFVPIPSGPNP